MIRMEGTFLKGFDADTAMFKHQSRVPRYWSNYQRALGLKKAALLRGGVAYDAKDEPFGCGATEQQQAIMAAQTPEELHQVCTSALLCAFGAAHMHHVCAEHPRAQKAGHAGTCMSGGVGVGTGGHLDI